MDSSLPQRRGRQSYNAHKLRSLGSFSQSHEMEKREILPSLVKRIPDSTTSSGSSSSTCVSGQGGDTCEKPAAMTAALPIALGVCVPIVAIIVFLYLHRQYRKRLRREDKADAEKYKSMDFGMDINYNGGKGGKKGKKGTEEDLTRPPPHMRGLSLDPAHSPFFLNGPNPAKTFSDSDSIYEDRYHGIGPGMSRAGSRSNSPMPRRVATNESHSTMSPSFRHDADAKLLHNAQGNPISVPPRSHSIPQVTTSDSSAFGQSETSITAPEPAKTREGGLGVPANDATRDSYFEKNAQQIRRSNNYLSSFFTSSEPSWDQKQDGSSPPSSHVDSASSTVLDSASQGTKTPLTSMSDTDSLPPMPSSKQLDFGSSFTSPTLDSTEFADMDSKLQTENMSPEPLPSASGRMPLRLGMPASDALVQELPQPSVEYKVSALEQSRHKSFDASLHDLHISVVSAATSNLTDILNTPRDSTYPPPVPDLPSSRDESIASPRRSELRYDSYTTKGDTSTAPTSPMKSASHGYEFNFSRGDSFAGSMAESVYDDKYDQTYPMEDPYGLNLADDEYPDFPTHDNPLGSAQHAGDGYDHIPPRGQSLAAAMPNDGNEIVIPPRGESLVPSISFGEEEEDYDSVLDIEEYGMPEHNRLSMLMRPLPPDDPTENPEERANRIRSFYKEYFDDSQVHTSQRPLPSQAAEYYEDYRSEFQGGATLYDPKQNGFVIAAPSAPFAEPVTRRAMTPPPRGPPRFEGRNRSRAGSAAGPLPPRGPSSMSHLAPRGRSPLPPRNPSSMSGYLSPRGPPMSKFPPRGPSAMSNMSGKSHASRRPMPPPQPLMSLPTPSQLKDDAALFTASDFAPPLSYRDRQNGRRPESPMGARRPYSPAVRAFVPLNSSFDDLGNIPSPHMLRKSGTYNTLDFAPPPRFKNVDSGSDASSIRSGRSNVSAVQLASMRAGAYRMSRVPKQLAGTKQDIMAGLKPQWDIGR